MRGAARVCLVSWSTQRMQAFPDELGMDARLIMSVAHLVSGVDVTMLLRKYSKANMSPAFVGNGIGLGLSVINGMPRNGSSQLLTRREIEFL